MSDTSTNYLDCTEEAMQLLDLAKTQRGGEKRLTEGRRYLLITREYLKAYGDILPTNDRTRLEAQAEK